MSLTRLARCWLSLGLVYLAGTAVAAQVHMAVASNFTAPMQQIAKDFARVSGHQALLSFGSTGKFYAQIQHGAPFQVLLSADAHTPQRLERDGLAVKGTRQTYAIGRLVLWSRLPGLVDAQGAVLGGGNFSHLAIADPRLAPYGAAAIEVLQRKGLLDHLRPRLVQGENISQTYQFVASGNAALGFVALSQVMVGGKLSQGSAWVVPREAHTALHQDAILLNPGRDQPAALALLAYLQTPPARAVMAAYGYEWAP